MKNKAGALARAVLWGLTAVAFPVLSGVAAAVMSLGAEATQFLQAAFIAASLLPPLLLVKSGRLSLKGAGVDRFDREGIKRAKHFVPLIAVLVPAAVTGFYIKSASYLIGSLLLYMSVGISEEVYYRGIVPNALEKAFSKKGVAALSTLVFGLFHAATALNGGGAADTALTVFNALIFGLLAFEIKELSGNIAIPAALHFLFDFETKIIPMSGTGLMLAECVRGFIMCALAVWLAFAIKNRGRARREKNTKRRRAALAVVSAVVLLAAGAAAGLAIYGREQMKKIPDMSFADCLNYTLEGSENGVITVGVIKDGQAEYTVYGKDGRELPKEARPYEIGSLTKTFTAAMTAKAADEGRLSPDDTIDKYLPNLPADKAYPTISDLLTHTSGLKGWYMEYPMIGNFLKGRNDFCGVTGDMVVRKLASLKTKMGGGKFEYSNFGYATLGLVLESVYKEEYTHLANAFAAEAGLENTRISEGDVENGWEWTPNDAYMAAGALVSNIDDMLKYARLQLDPEGAFGECHRIIKEINATSQSNLMMNIRMDSIGMAWLTDGENGIIWHNGATGSYNCYLGFMPESGAAVVVLSNLPHSYRIPATVLGVKLLTEMKAAPGGVA